MNFIDRLAHAWSVFKDRDHPPAVPDVGPSLSLSNHRQKRYSPVNGDGSIMTSIVTRISSDIATLEFYHARLDDNHRFKKPVKDSGLHYCLNEEANIDQSPRPFKADIARTILSEGVAAIVPVETTVSPIKTGGFDIKSLRVGTVQEWFPKHVRVELYNDITGVREDVVLPKNMVAIVENPFYAIMNEPNSTLQRLLLKLNQMDDLDESIANKKLDMIIQVPYAVKSQKRMEMANQRRDDIEFQLRQSQYGIAYADGTEKIVQLNRPLENNMLPNVEYMRDQLYSQLGITSQILEGTANEQEMLNYYTRTVEPLADAIAEEMSRKFLTKTARTQGQRVIYLRQPFRLVPMKDIAEIGDKFTRNEILTSNEIRSMIGFRPSDQPQADDLRNANMPVKDTGHGQDLPSTENPVDRQNESENDERT